ncbi:DUF4263 domain-containing protein (plasmid) [Streptomyces sp. NBC_00178]|uniref:Shedu immune nuclease family protein n=1 Tax=Streptomyces sp. NBC_00178 TaxID=2975672 RepID=UPI002E29F4BC|nr:Shedu immune nuclease family protein [Streptomyces sp. NBC_00178]
MPAAGQATPSGADSTAVTCEETGEVLQGAAGQIDAGRVDKHAKAPGGLVILVVNPSTRGFLHVRCRGRPSNLPSGWKQLSLLTDQEYFEQERKSAAGPEAVWQKLFEENPWIFGYGLNLVACEPLNGGKLERFTTGANIFTGAGKRSDAVMRSKGFISSLLLCEIKTHLTPLLAATPYRLPDVYQVSKEVVGAVAQVQKTAHKALRQVAGELHTLYEDSGAPTDIEVATVRPKQVLVIGNLRQLTERNAGNPEKIASFEQYRRSVQDVEVITFDELYERACFIVGDR